MELPDLIYPELYHVGLVVEDVDAAAFSSLPVLGTADFYRRFTSRISDGLLRGTRVSYTAEIGLLNLGNVRLELIAPNGFDPSPYRAFLDERGPGVHHLAYVVPSIDARLEAVVAAGGHPIVAFDGLLEKGAGRFAYIEGLMEGVTVEFVEYYRPIHSVVGSKTTE